MTWEFATGLLAGFIIGAWLGVRSERRRIMRRLERIIVPALTKAFGRELAIRLDRRGDPSAMIFGDELEQKAENVVKH